MNEKNQRSAAYGMVAATSALEDSLSRAVRSMEHNMVVLLGDRFNNLAPQAKNKAIFKRLLLQCEQVQTDPLFDVFKQASEKVNLAIAAAKKADKA